tara:strand:- start:171 stop:698 length:528 start_codon:yes stop_codon:yes gene_type:complete
MKNKIHSKSYTIGPGSAPNPVFSAALAYLDAAENAYSRETAKTGFLTFKNWFVVHHLSVIATELFVKSFRVTVSHPTVTSENGPDGEAVAHAYRSHNTLLDKLDLRDKNGLEDYLSDALFKLLLSASKDEISRGRYPYEDHNGSTRFPASDEGGQKLAGDWLTLARALSNYKRNI